MSGPGQTLADRADRSSAGRRALAGVAVITAGALLLRLYQIDRYSLWLDEAYSVWFSTRGWAYLWQEVPRFETHPAFYYSLLKSWSALGRDEVTLRLLSVLVNVSTVPFVALAAYFCANARDRVAAPCLAALLFALSDTQIFSAQDVRPYALMSLAFAMALASTFALMRSTERASRPPGHILRHDRGILAAYGGVSIGLALLAWSHNLGPFFDLFFGACLIAWWVATGLRPALLVNLSCAAALTVLLYAPNIPIILMQMEVMGENGFWLWRPGLGELIDKLLRLPLGTGALAGATGLLAGLAVLLGVWGAWRTWRQPAEGRDRPAWIVPLTLLVLAFGPAMALFVLSRIGQPIFLFRTFQASQVAAIVALALAPSAAAALSRRDLARPLAVALLVILALNTTFTYYLGPPTRPASEDWRGLTQRIAGISTQVEPTVVIVPASVELPLAYYEAELDIPLDLVVVPESYPAIGPAYRYPAGGGGVPGITPDMLRSLDARLEGKDETWFVSRAADVFDPRALLSAYAQQTFPCLVEAIPPAAELRRRPGPDGDCGTR